MKRSFFCLLTVFLLFGQGAFGQSDSTFSKVFKGKIIDDSLGYTIPFVHLWNESSRYGTISNESGEFEIAVSDNDTLVFSAIGYLHAKVVANTTTAENNAIVKLKPQKYEIGAAVVKRYRSYESFQEQFLKLDLSNTKTTYLREHINGLGTVIALEADRERAVKDKMNGFGYTSALNGRIDRDRAKLIEIQKQKRKAQVINEKFNRELVSDITQLKDKELTDFIVFCNFSDDYLYEADLYTVIESISQKLLVFQGNADTLLQVN